MESYFDIKKIGSMAETDILILVEATYSGLNNNNESKLIT